jgi:hypothetical protein
MTVLMRVCFILACSCNWWVSGLNSLDKEVAIVKASARTASVLYFYLLTFSPSVDSVATTPRKLAHTTTCKVRSQTTKQTNKQTKRVQNTQKILREGLFSAFFFQVFALPPFFSKYLFIFADLQEKEEKDVSAFLSLFCFVSPPLLVSSV